ncbi:MAG: hypothetical protein JSV97_06320 [candidate division WOR-3 bacterium]|nr:MAG: hypothetical protein JSV97_06320 [candidate division WOR-3 bacterium]
MNDAKRLSSNLTIIFKFFFPIVWLIGWGYGVLVSLLNRDPQGALFVAIWIIVFFVYIKFLFPLKMVWMSSDYLIVSNFFRKIRIPFHAIESVKENKWTNTKNVTITLKIETEFGNKIVFMPSQSLTDVFNLWSASKTTKLLKEKLDEYRGNLGK